MREHRIRVLPSRMKPPERAEVVNRLMSAAEREAEARDHSAGGGVAQRGPGSAGRGGGAGVPSRGSSSLAHRDLPTWRPSFQDRLRLAVAELLMSDPHAVDTPSLRSRAPPSGLPKPGSALDTFLRQRQAASPHKGGRVALDDSTLADLAWEAKSAALRTFNDRLRDALLDLGHVARAEFRRQGDELDRANARKRAANEMLDKVVGSGVTEGTASGSGGGPTVTAELTSRVAALGRASTEVIEFAEGSWRSKVRAAGEAIADSVIDVLLDCHKYVVDGLRQQFEAKNDFVRGQFARDNTRVVQHLAKLVEEERQRRVYAESSLEDVRREVDQLRAEAVLQETRSEVLPMSSPVVSELATKLAEAEAEIKRLRSSISDAEGKASQVRRSTVALLSAERSESMNQRQVIERLQHELAKKEATTTAALTRDQQRTKSLGAQVDKLRDQLLTATSISRDQDQLIQHLRSRLSELEVRLREEETKATPQTNVPVSSTAVQGSQQRVYPAAASKREFFRSDREGQARLSTSRELRFDSDSDNGDTVGRRARGGPRDKVPIPVRVLGSQQVEAKPPPAFPDRYSSRPTGPTPLSASESSHTMWVARNIASKRAVDPTVAVVLADEQQAQVEPPLTAGSVSRSDHGGTPYQSTGNLLPRGAHGRVATRSRQRPTSAPAKRGSPERDVNSMGLRPTVSVLSPGRPRSASSATSDRASDVDVPLDGPRALAYQRSLGRHRQRVKRADDVGVRRSSHARASSEESPVATELRSQYDGYRSRRSSGDKLGSAGGGDVGVDSVDCVRDDISYDDDSRYDVGETIITGYVGSHDTPRTRSPEAGLPASAATKQADAGDRVEYVPPERHTVPVGKLRPSSAPAVSGYSQAMRGGELGIHRSVADFAARHDKSGLPVSLGPHATNVARDRSVRNKQAAREARVRSRGVREAAEMAHGVMRREERARLGLPKRRGPKRVSTAEDMVVARHSRIVQTDLVDALIGSQR